MAVAVGDAGARWLAELEATTHERASPCGIDVHPRQGELKP